MDTHADVIKELGGYIVVSEALNVPKTRVSVWKTRERIPANYWLDLSRFAEREGVVGISLDVLKKLSPERKITRKAA